MHISENIYLLHKKSLPNDPIHLFKSKKIKCFFKSIYNLNWIKVQSKNKEIICFVIVFPFFQFILFLYVIFLATFYKSLRTKKKRISKKRLRNGILVYICVEKEFRGNLIGSNIINSFRNDGFKNIFLITKESTYKSFYKKFKNSKINLFGKCFCLLKLWISNLFKYRYPIGITNTHTLIEGSCYLSATSLLIHTFTFLAMCKQKSSPSSWYTGRVWFVCDKCKLCVTYLCLS